jgi:chitin disaccharide deacetylase
MWRRARLAPRIVAWIAGVFLAGSPAACAPAAAMSGARAADLAPVARLTARDVLARLGYPDTARLVILHADDMAITPGGTRATVQALLTRGISSASILATSPFLEGLAPALPRGEPFDLGVHLTLTSETPAMSWRPAARSGVRSLLAPDGNLPVIVSERARAAEIEHELSAQVGRVRALGITPTHLDSHQGALLFHGPERFGALRRVAARECLPIPVPESVFGQFPYLASALDDGQIPLADLVSIEPSVPPAQWREFYAGAIAGLRPGVTMLIVHLGEDTPDERVLYRDHSDYGAEWRARDAHLALTGALRDLAREKGAVVVTWREVARAARLCASGR